MFLFFVFIIVNIFFILFFMISVVYNIKGFFIMYFILKIEIYKCNLMEYNVNKNVLSKFFFCMVFDDN